MSEQSGDTAPGGDVGAPAGEGPTLTESPADIQVVPEPSATPATQDDPEDRIVLGSPESPESEEHPGAITDVQTREASRQAGSAFADGQTVPQGLPGAKQTEHHRHRTRRAVPVNRQARFDDPARDEQEGTLFPRTLRFGERRSSYPDVFGLPEQLRPDWELDYPIASDVVLECAELGWASVRGASVRGEAKRFMGESRQDSIMVARITRADGKEILGAAVADGVGTCDLSHIGSSIACRAALSALRAAAGVPPGTAESFVARVVESLRSWADHAGVDASRLSTTLVAAVLEPVEGGAIGWLLRVGDSGASVTDGETTHELLDAASEETQGAIHSNLTSALPGTPGDARITNLRLADGATLVLWTDGFLPLLELPSTRGHYETLFRTRPAPGSPEFLWQVDSRVSSYDDDRTVLAIWVGNSRG